MTIGQCIFPIFCDPALRVEGRERDLSEVLSVDAMALWPQDVHAVAEGLLSEESLFVLLMPDALLHDILFHFHTLCLLDVSTACLEDRVHLRAQADIISNGAPRTLILHFPQHLFVGVAVQWVIRRVVRGDVEFWMFGHVFVGIFRLDLEEETVGVEELAPVPVLPPELVVIEVVHQVFREIQNTHPYIHWVIELQSALVDLDSRQVVIEDIGSSKRRAGDMYSCRFR